MTNHFRRILSLVVCVLLLAHLGAERTTGQRGKKAAKEYPLSCAGIRVGTSTDADVLRRYGKGYFVKEEGHTGGWYFVDPRHQVMMHVELGVDRIVDTVEYQQGVHLPVKPTAAVWKQAVTARLTPNEKVQGGISLGASAQVVLNRYGRPQKNRLKGSVRTVEYSADQKTMPTVLFYEANFRFHNDRLIALSLYNGE